MSSASRRIVWPVPCGNFVSRSVDGSAVRGAQLLRDTLGPDFNVASMTGAGIDGDAMITVFVDPATAAQRPVLVLNADSPAQEQQAAAWRLLTNLQAAADAPVLPYIVDVDAEQAKDFPGAIPAHWPVTPRSVKRFVHP